MTFQTIKFNLETTLKLTLQVQVPIFKIKFTIYNAILINSWISIRFDFHYVSNWSVTFKKYFNNFAVAFRSPGQNVYKTASWKWNKFIYWFVSKKSFMKGPTYVDLKKFSFECIKVFFQKNNTPSFSHYIHFSSWNNHSIWNSFT